MTAAFPRPRTREYLTFQGCYVRQTITWTSAAGRPRWQEDIVLSIDPLLEIAKYDWVAPRG